jgi:hypothetical protein
MVNFSDAELTELETNFVHKENVEAYKKWLKAVNTKQAEAAAKNKSEAKNLLRSSLSGVKITEKKIRVPVEPQVLPYPLEFANDQLLNKWLETTLKNLENGSKPLAILESITGIALLEGKLMSLVMTVLNGVLTDDDLKNMTIYGVKSFATTRFAKLFFDDFGEMLPVMNEIGDPLEVLQIVDKLREAMANPDTNKNTAAPDVSDADMMATLNKWYSGDTRQQLTQYLVDNFKFTAPPAEQGAATLEEGAAEGATVEEGSAEGAAQATSPTSFVDSITQKAADLVKGTQKRVDEKTETDVNANEEARADTDVREQADEKTEEEKGNKDIKKTATLSQLKDKPESNIVSDAIKESHLGGTRRNTAPSQAATRKRWYAVTLRDVLSGTQ